MLKKILSLFLFSYISLFGFEHLNPNSFDGKLKDKNVIVDFYATWCPPCKILGQTLKDFDKVKSSNVVIYKVDIDKHMGLAQKYDVRALPTLVFFKNGKVITKEVGIKSVPQLDDISKRYFN